MKKKFNLLIVLMVFICGISGCAQKSFVPNESTPQETTPSSPSETSQEMTVTFLDVGQGDCTIVRSGNNTMLIDAGDNGAGDVVTKYLSDNNIELIDYFVLTHPDADHVGGADDVLNSVKVKNVIMPDIESDTKTFNDVKTAISLKKVNVIHPSINDPYTPNDATLQVVCPETVSKSDPNNSSIGIKLTHGKKVFVMCGDAEEKSETKMVERYENELECDVLKCGHHGSRTATSDEFLEATNPTFAIISCGDGNRYGHPHAEVISKLEDDDVQVYRTDKLGTITATSDGNNITWAYEK